MRWEYLTLDCERFDDRGYTSLQQPSEDQLNAFGAEGWELICALHRTLIFKRPCAALDAVPKGGT